MPTLTRAHRHSCAQAQWYVYAKMHISKQSFNDNYFKQMLMAGGTKKLLEMQQLKKWVRAEFSVFLLYLKMLLNLKMDEAQGNAFAQFLHDGGTLESHQKYQAFAIQFIAAQWFGNLTVCFGLVACADGHDLVISKLAVSTFEARVGLKFGDVFGSVISDRAAKGVGNHLDVDEVEVCLMHDGDKVGASAIGLLTRSKNSRIVNPFRKGEVMVENARKMSSSLTMSHNYEAFWEFANDTVKEVPRIVIKVDHNGTRIAATHILLLSILRLNRGLKVWHASKKVELQLQWTSSEEGWQAMAEAEAVLNVSRITTTLAQYEGRYTGAYACLIKGTTMNALRAPTMAVVELEKVREQSAAKLPRTMKSVREFGPVGAEVRRRAQLEAERRFCGNKTEIVEMNAEIIMSDRELLASVLDLRTLGCLHMSEAQRKQAKALFMTAYVGYTCNARNFEEERRAAWEAKAEAEAAAARAEMGKKAGKASAEEPKEKKPKIASGAKFGGSAWSSDDEEDEPSDGVKAQMQHVPDDEVPGMPNGVEAPSVKEFAKIEAKKVWKNWTKLLEVIDWSEQFKDAELPEEPDIVFDLMELDMGIFYNKIIKSDANRKIYGYIPAMASCCHAEIGALNAESFCERVLSAANLVVNEGNTLLSSDEVEMLGVLRINRTFMEKMRASKYAEEAAQQFNMTLVEMEAASAPASGAAGPSSAPVEM